MSDEIVPTEGSAEAVDPEPIAPPPNCVLEDWRGPAAAGMPMYLDGALGRPRTVRYQGAEYEHVTEQGDLWVYARKH